MAMNLIPAMKPTKTRGEMLDSEDILCWIVDNYPASTILEWMGDKALDPTLECVNEYFNENYREVEDDNNEG